MITEYRPTPIAANAVFIGFREQTRRGYQTRLWCDWCCVWHIHGDTVPGTVTHRVAHCCGGSAHLRDSPYRRVGYWIATCNTPFEAVRSLVRCATFPQRLAIAEGRITPGVRSLREQRPPFAYRVPAVAS